MTETPTTPLGEPRKARRKVTTDLGRQLLQKERQRLSREQAALGEQLAEEAHRKAAAQQMVKRQANVAPESIAIQRGIVKRFAGVLASEGLNVKITAQPTAHMKAWTDFDQIYIGYRMHDDIRLLAATMRGLAYHEGGHCRFTLPFMQLAEAAGISARDAVPYHHAWNMLEDQRMETAVVSDSPRKAAYIAPVIMTELLDTVNSAADNYPLIIWRRYLSKKVRRGARKLFVVKQNAAGNDGEALAKAWERTVTKYVLADNANDMMAAVADAQDLLQVTHGIAAALDDSAMGHDRQRRAERDLSDALVIPIDPGMLQEADEMMDYDDEEAEVDVTDEDVARHLAEVFSVIMLEPHKLLTVVYAIPMAAEEEKQDGEPSPKAAEQDDDESEAPEADDDEDEEGDDDDTEDDAESAHGDEDDTDEADDDESDEDDDDHDPEREGGSTGAHDPEEVAQDEPADEEEEDDELTDEDLSEALQEVEDERDSDPTLDADVDAFNQAKDDRVSNLMPYQTQVSTDLLSKAAAENLATSLEESFQAATMDQAPAWVEGQRRGALNVLRYKTRQPGDAEIFRQWTDTDQPGFNIAVSVLLDYSGSMCGATEELAEAGYAAKLACDKLGIPCTVVLWDTNAQVLWDANEKAEYLPVITSAGGTDPSVALADLINQRYEKAQHVVLIMTDGEWSSNQGNSGYLASYKEEGRVIIGMGYDENANTANNIADKLRRYGCDESYAISNLMDIPRQLESTLSALA